LSKVQHKAILNNTADFENERVENRLTRIAIRKIFARKKNII